MQVKHDSNGYEVNLDVHNFNSDELEVKLAGHRLTVGGKHGQRADEQGYITREFHSEFDIPKVG